MVIDIGDGTSDGFARDNDFSGNYFVDFKHGINTSRAKELIRYLDANLTGDCTISLFMEIGEHYNRPENNINKTPRTIEERLFETDLVVRERVDFKMSGEIFRNTDDSSLNYSFIVDDTKFPLTTEFYRMELTCGREIDVCVPLDKKNRNFADEIKSTVERYFLDMENVRKMMENRD